MALLQKDLLKTIQRIQIETGHLAEDLLAGSYKSAFKGQGIEFEEDREYQEGDDVRLIDWNVTTRMGKPFVKVFREEREITVMLVVDISPSSLYGSGAVSKREIITQIGALLAFSAIKNNDKVGLLLFTDQVELYVPARKGSRHVLRIIRELLAFEPKGKGTNLNQALHYLGNVIGRSMICFIISDFNTSDATKEMTLMAKKHDLISISVTDPQEINFPDVGLINLQDLETGETLVVDTSSKQVRELLRKRTTERLTAHAKLMRKIGAGNIDIMTDQPYVTAIRKFFKTRSKQRR